MEEQFILRVTPSIAEKLDRLLSETASSSEEQSLDLSFSEDGRGGTFVIGNEHFPASLLDLPCFVESYKTYDDCALVKTADIGQMIMVREAGDTAPDVVEYRHGLTPPMRDARKRRFRREPYLNPELVQRVEKDLLNIMAGGTVENADILTYNQEYKVPLGALMHALGKNGLGYISIAKTRSLGKCPLVACRLLRMVLAAGQLSIIPICVAFYGTAMPSTRPMCSFNHSIKSLTEFLQAEANEQEEDGEQNARKANKKPEPAPETKPDVPETTANAEEPERSDSDESDDSM
uniref:TATA-binding protein-associated factor TAFII55 n=1 Tax=Populus alba TaxID=43335 RepID=A0A4U5Q5P4_POPAL|nr:TATA-binding protein-associated factor TAFII55 [Populus alba]